jgi:hypothetical protein
MKLGISSNELLEPCSAYGQAGEHNGMRMSEEFLKHAWQGLWIFSRSPRRLY